MFTLCDISTTGYRAPGLLERLVYLVPILCYSLYSWLWYSLWSIRYALNYCRSRSPLISFNTIQDVLRNQDLTKVKVLLRAHELPVDHKDRGQLWMALSCGSAADSLPVGTDETFQMYAAKFTSGTYANLTSPSLSPFSLGVEVAWYYCYYYYYCYCCYCYYYCYCYCCCYCYCHYCWAVFGTRCVHPSIAPALAPLQETVQTCLALWFPLSRSEIGPAITADDT